MAFLRSLPPTPEAYRSGVELGDLMLGEHAGGYVGGAGSCAGCGEATAIRMVVAATRQVHGPESMGIVAATGCNSVYGATYPFNPYRVPWTNSLFENAPADALGIRARWDQDGHPERRLWVLGGDGAMYDIGFQSLSRMVASGADIKVLVLDTQVYSNTGGQASTATFGGQVTKLSAFGKAQHGKVERRKELGRILVSHGEVYVAQVSTAHVNHFYRAVMEANTYPGPAVLIAYTPCMPEHGIADDAGARSVRAAVDSRTFPLFTYDPRRGPSVAARLDLDGNPSPGSDWHRLPDGTELDFISFARGEGRFAPHFAADGTPSDELLSTRDDRLANWRTLQELAGVGTRDAARPSVPLSFDEVTPTLTAEAARAAAATCLQCEDPTCIAACPIRVDIPRYLEHVVAGDFAAAAAVLAERNPMAAVTGRVCEQERQCEGSCRRAKTEGTVPIGAIERFVADWARENLPASPAAAVPTGGRVAIVGGGPGGLACARALAERGHEVTVFDDHPAAGGVLRYGIPDFRLPKPIVDVEIERLRALGVRFELGTRIGADRTLDAVRGSHDAVFLAVGADEPAWPRIPGEELEGVTTATRFLEQVKEGVPTGVSGADVIVLGGGNVAMDAARSARRLGAESVTIVYRRGRAEAPACAAELHEAEAEGIGFVFLAAPLAIIGDDAGRARAVRCERMVLGSPDTHGRPRPMPTGDAFELHAQTVVLALGSRVSADLGGEEPVTADAGTLAVDEAGRTSLAHVYAGGDAVRGPATVVEAIGDGLRAAAAIDAELRRAAVA
jgi:homotetrameric NADPH-dependent glutamate synthase